MEKLNEVIRKLEELSNKKVMLIENRKLAKQLFLDKGLISQQQFDEIVNIDPSPQKKYVFWLVKNFLNEKTDLNDLKNTIEEFNTFVNKDKFKDREKDINYYKTFNDLKAAVSKINQTGGASLKELENDYKVILNNENLYIASPQTHEASRKLGLTTFKHRGKGDNKDSAWCTTFKNDTHFNNYYLKDNVTFYYILVKSEEIKKNLRAFFGSRASVLYIVAFAVLPDGRIDAYDANDKQMSQDVIKNYKKIIGVS